MNSLNAVGNLASDVDIRDAGTAPDGSTRRVASFLLAINRPGQDAGADFVRVSAWGGQAESCHKYLAKGKKVAVEGRIRTSRKENEDGSFTNYFEINASRVEFLTPREQSSEEQGVQVAAEAPAAAPGEATASNAVTPAAAAPATDDIPF